MRKYHNATKRPVPALVWSPVAGCYRSNRAARRSRDWYHWHRGAVEQSHREHARAVALLLTGKEA